MTAPAPLPGANPTITAIDEGHILTAVQAKGAPDLTVCRACRTPWPCDPIRAARAVTAARTELAVGHRRR